MAWAAGRKREEKKGGRGKKAGRKKRINNIHPHKILFCCISSTPLLPLPPTSSDICLHPPPLFPPSAAVRHSLLPSAAVFRHPPSSAVRRRPPPPSTHRHPPPPTYPRPPTSLLLSTPVLTPHCKVSFFVVAEVIIAGGIAARVGIPWRLAQ